MPDPLTVDREQVRLVAVQIGVREAARQFGLPENTVKTWSGRYGWFKEAAEQQQLVETARETKRVRQGLSPREPTAAEILEKYGKETRLSLAAGIARGAETVRDMDGQEVLLASQQVSQLTKAAATVHGWQSTGPSLSVRLDVIAQSGPDSPVIDI